MTAFIPLQVWGAEQRRRNAPVPLAAFVAALLSYCVAEAQQQVSLMTPTTAWSFGNGAEFPGAVGGLSIDVDARKGGRDGFKLRGDFTKGGNYVQAGRDIPSVDVRDLSMWVRNPGADRLTLRINDASGQTHQIDLKTEPQSDWQRVAFPLERFFSSRGRADAVAAVARYESWGGAKDGRWHGPAKAIYFLLGNPGGDKRRTLWFKDLVVSPPAATIAGADVPSVVRLDEIIDGEHDWHFSIGQEFPGARGSLTCVGGPSDTKETGLKLAGDFTGGGAYIAATKDLHELDFKSVAAIRLRVKSDNATSIGVRLVDASSQTHQASLAIVADGRWRELAIVPTKIAGGEHWGGANDGKWHGRPTLLAICLSSKADEKTKRPVVYLSNVRAEGISAFVVQPAAFKCDFEQTARLGADWTVQGGVSIESETAFEGRRSLLLSRSLEDGNRPTTAASPPFSVAAGQWAIGLACKSDLKSPDDSYAGVASLECLDSQAAVIRRIPIADLFDKRDWQPVKKRVDIPKGPVSARYHFEINKAAGRFWVDDLSAAYLTPAARKEDRIERLLFTTARLGNLLFPEDLRRVSVSIEANKPLRASQQTLAYEVRDYWGAEQMRFGAAAIERSGKKDGRFLYRSSIDLSGVPLEIGRYYELHAAIPQEGSEPFRNFTSFAVLPEAETKRHSPEEVPFTSRNWDNRFPEYFQLSDRLGLRTCGVWGGWASTPPYKPEAPNIEFCRKLGMGVLTGTPAASIEQGEKKYSEEALRQGVRNFLKEFGGYRPLIVNLGNEPHGVGDRVLANVAAYRTVYQEIKKVDPSVYVVATSVEPNEEYFRAGYGKWCDAYDFHVYEDHENVRKAISDYRALFQKYGDAKPIWSTELGLNSQGLPRHAAAVDLIKKFTVFFAAGGAKASWFGLLYPDGDATSFGSSGDSHNVFDCRYNHYCPRLDAIAYYNAVNAISIKKFIAEKQYPDGVNAFLFRDRDGRSLQVWWKLRGRQDVFVPLPGVAQATIVRIDGGRRLLDAAGEGLSLSVSEDPLLLLYDRGGDALPAALGTSAAAIFAAPRSFNRDGENALTVSCSGVAADALQVIAPPFWTVTKSTEVHSDKAASSVRIMLTAPKNSAVREADLILQLPGAHGPRGELYFRCPLSD